VSYFPSNFVGVTSGHNGRVLSVGIVNFGQAFVIFGVRFLSGVEELLCKIVAPSLGFNLNKIAQI